jgi:hypothetical protein
MKRAALAALAIVAGFWEFRDDLAYWLPAVGSLSSGYALGQIVILGFPRRYHFRNSHLFVLSPLEFDSRLIRFSCFEDLETFLSLFSLSNAGQRSGPDVTVERESSFWETANESSSI